MATNKGQQQSEVISYYDEEYGSEYESEVAGEGKQTNRKGSARSRKTAGVISQGLVNNKYIDDRPVPYRKPPAEIAQKRDVSPKDDGKDMWAFAQQTKMIEQPGKIKTGRTQAKHGRSGSTSPAGRDAKSEKKDDGKSYYDEEYESEYEDETEGGAKKGGAKSNRSKKSAKEKSRIGGASQASNNIKNVPDDSDTGYSQPFLSTKRKLQK